MSNAPFTDNIDPQDLKIIQTYIQVQALAMTSLRKERDDLKIEVEQLKKQQYRNMTVESLYNSMAKDWAQWAQRGGDSFISTAALKRIDEHDTRLAKLEKKESHEYEGSERWSPELGDEVYRDGKWVPQTKSKHPDDDQQLIAEAKLYYGMSTATWYSLSKIAQVALMRHYNKED